VTFEGPGAMRVTEVPEPTIEAPRGPRGARGPGGRSSPPWR